MGNSTDVDRTTTPNSAVTVDEKVAVSLVFRNVSKENREKLEQLAKAFAKKHRKLVNYIEK